MSFTPYTWNPASEIDWNNIQFEDDSLRDGMQSPYIKQLDYDEKIDHLKHLNNIGIEHCVLSYPASSQESFEESKKILQHVSSWNDCPMIWFLSRSLIKDIEPILELQKTTNRNIGITLFIGMSPIRCHVEKWNFASILNKIEIALTFIKKNNLTFSFNFEDVTRTPWGDIKTVIDLVLKYNPYSIALCDTVGEATPSGANRLIKSVQDYIKIKKLDVKLLWHGHNDKGLATANAVTALESGANIISGTFLGIGERSGNTSLEQMITYSYQLGATRYNIKGLIKYCEKFSKVVEVDIPNNMPILGEHIFTTSSGIHASAIHKASKISTSLADSIYSSVPAQLLGRKQSVYINYNSGVANIRFILESHGIKFNDNQVMSILEDIKSKKTHMTEEEFINYWDKQNGTN